MNIRLKLDAKKSSKDGFVSDVEPPILVNNVGDYTGP